MTVCVYVCEYVSLHQRVTGCPRARAVASYIIFTMSTNKGKTIILPKTKKYLKISLLCINIFMINNRKSKFIAIVVFKIGIYKITILMAN